MEPGQGAGSDAVRQRRLYSVGAGVGCGQPAEEALVRGGGVLLRSPVLGHVVRVGHHQLPTVQVRTQDKRDVLHPVDHRPGF